MDNIKKPIKGTSIEVTSENVNRYVKRLQKTLNEEENINISLANSGKVFAKVLGMRDFHELQQLLGILSRNAENEKCVDIITTSKLDNPLITHAEIHNLRKKEFGIEIQRPAFKIEPLNKGIKKHIIKIYSNKEKNSIEYVKDFFKFVNNEKHDNNWRAMFHKKVVDYISIEDDEQIYLNKKVLRQGQTWNGLNQIVKFRIFDVSDPIPVEFNDVEKLEALRMGFVENITGLYQNHYFNMIKKMVLSVNKNYERAYSIYSNTSREDAIDKSQLDSRGFGKSNKNLEQVFKEVVEKYNGQNVSVVRSHFINNNGVGSYVVDSSMTIDEDSIYFYNEKNEFLFKIDRKDICQPNIAQKNEGKLDKMTLKYPHLLTMIDYSKKTNDEYINGFE